MLEHLKLFKLKVIKRMSIKLRVARGYGTDSGP